VTDQNTRVTEAKPRASWPVGIKLLVVVNALVALTLLLMFLQYTGGRALLYLCAGILHAVLALGLYLRQGWASIVMIAYALFQIAGMGLWALIGLMTLAVEPLSEEKARFLILAAVAIPFLSWAVVYLLGQLRRPPTSTSEVD